LVAKLEKNTALPLIQRVHATCNWGEKRITDLHLLPSFRMHGNVPLLLHTPSLRNIELNTMQTFRLSVFILRIILCGQEGESQKRCI